MYHGIYKTILKRKLKGVLLINIFLMLASTNMDTHTLSRNMDCSLSSTASGGGGGDSGRVFSYSRQAQFRPT